MTLSAFICGYIAGISTGVLLLFMRSASVASRGIPPWDDELTEGLSGRAGAWPEIEKQYIAGKNLL